MANEKRLIDANALMKAIKSFRWIGPPNTLKLMFEYLRLIIRDQPTVDAVEVVRCKDCRYFDMTHGRFDHLCSKMVRYMGADDFCSFGERKDNGC